MVGRQDHQVLLAHLFQETGQPGIKFRQSAGISRRVSPMAEQHVKVHQIDKAQSVEVFLGILHGLFHAVAVGRCVYVLCDAFPCENVKNLADCDGVISCLPQRIQNRFCRWFQRKVMAVGGSLVCAGAADKRTRNHTSHTMLAPQQFPGNPAIPIEFLRGNDILMGCNLKHRICRGVHDQFSGA